MKRILIIFLSFSSLAAFGQNKTLAVGTPTANPNAALHVESPTNNQGVLFPRLTTAQRTAMSLTVADKGLMVFDTDLNGVQVWSGTAWTNTALGLAKIPMPYKDSVATATGTNDLFLLKYNNAEAKRMMRFENLNAANPGITVSALQKGTGLAGYFQVDNPTGGGTALEGTTNSNVGGAVAPVGVYGESSGTGSLGGAFWNTNPANTFPALYARTLGTGNASYFEIVNAANSAAALRVETNGTGNAIQTSGKIQAGQFIGDGSGLTNVVSSPVIFPYSNTTTASASTMFDIANTGTGKAGRFTINNASNADNALYVSTTGTGENAWFEVNNPTSSGSAIIAQSNSLGANIWAQNTSATSGGTANFENSNTSNTGNVLFARSLGVGNVARFSINNPASTGSAVFASTNSNQAFTAAVYGLSTGTGDCAGCFRINNPASDKPALYSETNGTGAAFFGNNIGPAGTAGSFNISQSGNTYPALYSSTSGSGVSIMGNSLGTGSAGYFEKNGTGTNAAVGAQSQIATAGAGWFKINSGTNPNATLYAETIGTGPAGHFNLVNPASGNVALYATTNGTDAAILGESSTSGAVIRARQSNSSGIKNAILGLHDGAGQGHAGLFKITNAANNYPAIQAETAGTGPGLNVLQNATSLGAGVGVYIQNPTSTGIGVTVNQQGLGQAGQFIVNNAANSGPCLYTQSNGGDGAIIAVKTGTGNSAGFYIANTSNSGVAIDASTDGTGNVMNLNHQGVSGDIALFRSSGLPKARIDKTGQGFFNGGTQNSGADVAELFDVEGPKSQYEPGDVLVISETTDRTAEKSFAPNSTKVAGVYATKPGVTLTEKDMNESTDALVPMGVIGVIPTKVCLENGPIKRGDLLVTSSSPGKAMKAIAEKGDGIYPAGVILGKALENYDGTGSGLIKVLVNVK